MKSGEPRRVYSNSFEVEANACQWTGANYDVIRHFIGFADLDEEGRLVFMSVGGVKRMSVGDWVIKSDEGDCAPCAEVWYEALFQEVQ